MKIGYVMLILWILSSNPIVSGYDNISYTSQSPSGLSSLNSSEISQLPPISEIETVEIEPQVEDYQGLIHNTIYEFAVDNTSITKLSWTNPSLYNVSVEFYSISSQAKFQLNDNHIIIDVNATLEIFSLDTVPGDELLIELSSVTSGHVILNLFDPSSENIQYSPTDDIHTNQEKYEIELGSNTLSYQIYSNNTLLPFQYPRYIIESNIDEIYIIGIRSSYNSTWHNFTLVFDFTTPANSIISSPTYADTIFQIEYITSEPINRITANFDNSPVNIQSANQSHIKIEPYFIPKGFREISINFIDYAGNINTIVYSNFFNHTDYITSIGDTVHETGAKLELSWSGDFQTITGMELDINSKLVATFNPDFEIIYSNSSYQDLGINFFSLRIFTIDGLVYNNFTVNVIDTASPGIEILYFSNDITRDIYLNFIVHDYSPSLLSVTFNDYEFFTQYQVSDSQEYNLTLPYVEIGSNYTLEIYADDTYQNTLLDLSGQFTDKTPPVFLKIPNVSLIDPANGTNRLNFQYFDQYLNNVTISLNDTLIYYQPGYSKSLSFVISGLSTGFYSLNVTLFDLWNNTASHIVQFTVLPYPADISHINNDQSIMTRSLILSIIMGYLVVFALRRFII